MSKQHLADIELLRQEAIKIYMHHYVNSNTQAVHDIFNAIYKRIKNAPRVNAVVVTYCKDCEYYKELNGKDSGKPVGYGFCKHVNGSKGICYNESFCSNGERKSDD